MGISASYISQDGGARLFDLEGVPAPGSIAAGVLGAHATSAQLPRAGAVPLPMPEVPAMANEPDGTRITEENMMDVLSRKQIGNSSIVSNGQSLCLRGEEGGTPGGNLVYGAVGGMSGFFPIAQIDPGGGGIMLSGEGNKPDGSSVQLGGGHGATMRVGGRTDVRLDESSDDAIKWLVVKEFYRLAQVTPNGRISSVTKEIEKLVSRIHIPNGGSGGGGIGGLSCPVVLAGANSIIGQVNCNSSEALECFWRMVTGKTDEEDLVVPVTTDDYVAPYNFSSTGGYLDLWDFIHALNESYQQVLEEKSTDEKPLRGVVASCVSGLYAVRPIWTARSGSGTYNTPFAGDDATQYSLYALDFGTEAQLATWAGDKYLCDYDEDGELRETPVVKRLYVSSCPGGRSA